MALPPGPYSGTSTLALVARASAFTFGLVYGNIKLKVLKKEYNLEGTESTSTTAPSNQDESFMLTLGLLRACDSNYTKLDSRLTKKKNRPS
ncbi:hypothetical protein SDJN02_12979, partial [Cucurbita argyrosperma subsp. argyrosperma]